MYFSLLEPITQPLQTFLIWLNGIVASTIPLPPSISSWAIAIVLIAVIVKVGTQPLTSKQQESMRKMQAMQPKINELQKKYKNDREKLSQAQMELYREEGVNPFGGCLPLIVQMVVLFGMWRAIMGLTGTLEEPGPLMGEQFLWVPSLGQCEPSPLCGQEFSLLPFALPILLVTMVASQIVYQRLMTPPARSNDAQAQAMTSMMKFMPLLFAWIFIKFPAGIVLYYAAFNLVGLVQQTWINRRVASREAEEAQSDSGGKSKKPPAEPDEAAESSTADTDGDNAQESDDSDKQAASEEEPKLSERQKKRRRRRRKKSG